MQQTCSLDNAISGSIFQRCSFHQSHWWWSMTAKCRVSPAAIKLRCSVYDDAELDAIPTIRCHSGYWLAAFCSASGVTCRVAILPHANSLQQQGGRGNKPKSPELHCMYQAGALPILALTRHATHSLRATGVARAFLCKLLRCCCMNSSFACMSTSKVCCLEHMSRLTNAGRWH